MHLELVENEISGLVKPGDPGLAVGVYADGSARRTAATGAACVEFGVPIDARTRFDIASASKQFTAACVLLLARDGALSLDDDVRTHVPELALDVPVTLRQCLQHTGGLPEWYALQALTGVPLAEMTEERLLRMVSGIRATTFPPGTDFSYSNTGYILSAVVVSRVTGTSLAAFARERIFSPLGMDDSVFRDDAAAALPRLAYGYANADGEPRRADTQESAVGDGGLATSVSELAAWFGFLADGRVLGADLRDALLDRAVLADGTVLPYAFGIYHTEVAGRPAYAHAGGMHGYLSNLLYLPDPGFGVAVLSNQTAIDPVKLSDRLARVLLGEPPVAEQPPAAEPMPVPAGHWHDPAGDDTLTVGEGTDGAIELVVGGVPVTFTPRADGRWHGTGDADGAWLAKEGDRLLLGSASPARRPVAYVPCDPPGTEPLPDGVYLSEELGVLATVRDGELSVGTELRLPVEPAPAGTWRAGPFTLRPDQEDLLLSGVALRRMRFTGQPEGTRPVGFPR
ncbi:serine hydrolase domain-containing protein [Microtetraspora malaysiensis]|uniref:serine hydrolase domain-containing protein n=1 Tax=Microtetraspora malaysiensis TaxID=161358 RepID=UPI00083785E7|nr:serine hydrolase domain-containing protein [Microtetraspora malaysiensis]